MIITQIRVVLDVWILTHPNSISNGFNRHHQSCENTLAIRQTLFCHENENVNANASLCHSQRLSIYFYVIFTIILNITLHFVSVHTCRITTKQTSIEPNQNRTSLAFIRIVHGLNQMCTHYTHPVKEYSLLAIIILWDWTDV